MNSCIDTDQHLRADFLADVLAGLSSPNKTIPSRWLYDDAGLGVVLQNHETHRVLSHTNRDRYPAHPPARDRGILRRFANDRRIRCRIREKTEILLSSLRTPESYVTIDISEHALENVRERVLERFPDLDVISIAADFLTRSHHRPISATVRRTSSHSSPAPPLETSHHNELSSFFRNLPMEGPEKQSLASISSKASPDISQPTTTPRA